MKTNQENEKEQLKPIQVTGRDEMNLAEYPFAVLSKRVSESQKTIEIDLGVVKNRDGKLVPRRWIVTGSDKFGLPVAGDEEVYIGLMIATKEDDFASREVGFIKHRLFKEMGWLTDGRYAKRFEQALDRLTSVYIKAERVFWDNEKKCYKTKGFHVLESYTLYDEGKSWKSTKRQPISKIVWSEELWQSFKAHNIKKLDTEFWFSLKGSITKRLYRYLDKHFYWSPIHTIGLRELAFNHLGMPKTYYPKDIRRKLDPACDQLIEKGYLEKYYYQEGEKRKEDIVFVKSVQLELAMPQERKSEPLLLKQGDLLVAELVQRGITKTTAGKLCQKYNQDRVKEKIELLDYLKETDSPLVEKNPAGYLRKAIEEDYQPPKGFTTKAQREEKVKKEREQQQQQELKRKERQYQAWLAMSDEEKIKGDLIIWKQRFKRERGKTPTPEEIEGKTQELISDLPNAEKKLFGDLVQ